MRSAKGEDEDGPSVYECSTCPAFTRSLRGCQLWPPPELIRLREIAPAKVPDERGDKMRAAMMAQTWVAGEEARTAAALFEAIGMMADGENTCPVAEVSPVSRRILRHYNRMQAFGSGMGGTVGPRPDMDADVRMVHGFNIVANETERLRKLDRGDQ